jgi:5-methylcytosine-specific restriction endonuclease McrA
MTTIEAKKRVGVDKEKEKARKRQYYIENRAKKMEYIKNWKKENKNLVSLYKSKYKETHREDIKALSKKYFEKEYVKENINFNTAIYRSKRANLLTTLTREEWRLCKEYFYNECAYCGKKERLSKDHLVPLKKGGALSKDNILPTCRSCNVSKSTWDFLDWYVRQSFYSVERHFKILKYINVGGDVYRE